MDLSEPQNKDISKPPDYWRKPLDVEKYKIPHGVVHIIIERCKGCEFCIEFCPQKVFEVSDEFNSKGYHPPKIVSHDKCVNCKLCELICPEFAIYITEDEPMNII
jgi:2-oxoglutarate ferredoxin oxidoreductase subunit delta